MTRNLVRTDLLIDRRVRFNTIRKSENCSNSAINGRHKRKRRTRDGFWNLSYTKLVIGKDSHRPRSYLKGTLKY